MEVSMQFNTDRDGRLRNTPPAGARLPLIATDVEKIHYVKTLLDQTQ